ncbi:MAG: hypothetical protein AABW54_01815 [Candidatus Micrarchaeota archaeon]
MILDSRLLLLGISAVVSFAATLLVTPYFMRFMAAIGITGADKQKPGKPFVPTSGGMPVAFAFFLALMAFIALNTFLVKLHLNLAVLLAAGLSTFAIALVGFFDDLYVRKDAVRNVYGDLDHRVGLKQWMKPLLTLVAAIPLVAVKAGTTYMTFPVIGVVQLGWVYALVLIPLAVVCVSNASNMLAGVNGLEAGSLALASGAVFLWALRYGNVEGAVVALLGCAALAAFLFFNWFPARMLPGDSLTYFAGAVFISAVVLGNVEKFGFVVFLPWIAEALLKLRSGFKARSYGDLQKDGSLKAPYEKVYSLTHVAMKLSQRFNWRWGERQVTLSIFALQVLAIAFAFIAVKAPPV